MILEYLFKLTFFQPSASLHVSLLLSFTPSLPLSSYIYIFFSLGLPPAAKFSPSISSPHRSIHHTLITPQRLPSPPLTHHPHARSVGEMLA